MEQPPVGEIALDGLWRNNPGLVQLLGLCPLLAVTATVVNGLGLGIATLLTLMITNVSVSALRRWIRPEIRIPIYVLIIASVVTAIEQLMNAYFHGLHRILGIFIPLIVTNCAIIGRAEGFAARNNVPRALLDAIAMGMGFMIVLVLLGGMRELFGHGTLLDHAELLFGPAARDLGLTFSADHQGFLLAVLPPGAFFGLALLIAAKNAIDQRLARLAAAKEARLPQPIATRQRDGRAL